MNPAVEGSEPSGHPNGRKATVGLVAPVCKTGLYGAPLVQLQLRPHSHLLLVTDLLLSLRRTVTRFDSVTGLSMVFTFDLRLSSRLGLTFWRGHGVAEGYWRAVRVPCSRGGLVRVRFGSGQAAAVCRLWWWRVMPACLGLRLD